MILGIVLIVLTFLGPLLWTCEVWARNKMQLRDLVAREEAARRSRLLAYLRERAEREKEAA